MKKSIAVLTAIIITFSITVFRLNQTKGEELLIEVFNQSTFTPIQANINLYSVFENKFEDFEQMKDCIMQIENELNFVDEVESMEEESDDYMVVKKVYSNEQVKMTIKLETSDESYLTVDILVYEDCSKVMELKEYVENIFDNLGIKPKTNISVTGSYKGKLSVEQKKKISQEMMKQMGAEAREDYISEDVYSVTGYTKRIDEYINSAGKKINLNLAIRYNKYENKTYLYLATPLLVTEY